MTDTVTAALIVAVQAVAVALIGGMFALEGRRRNE